VRRRLSFTVVTRIAGVAYIGYLLVANGPLFYRLVLGVVAAVVVLTCHRWRDFALFASPLLLLALAYDELRLLSPARTGVKIDVTGVRDWELAWFGIHTKHGLVTPAQWFQSHTSPVLDFACGLVYLGFMEGFVALAAWWLFRKRHPEARAVMWALLALALICYTIHVLHPTAPPWYVQRYGTGPAVATARSEAAGGLRFDRLLGVSWFSAEYSNSTDVFGPMPSLHVGLAFLGALFAWRFRSLRVVATAFFGLIFLGSVYLDQHYIVDGLAGMVVAGLVFAATVYILRRTAPGVSREVGPTALVTGATSGIGLEFARQLAARGNAVVLVARSESRLQEVAAELEAVHDVRTEVLVADLADWADADRVAERARTVDTVVNSAGFGTRQRFLDNDLEEEMFDVLCRAILVICHAAGRAMKERGRGQIINVSSVAGWLASGTYSAAKSWVTVFSESLAGELVPSGVTVTALCPGFVRTEFHQRAGIGTGAIPGHAWLDARRVVRTCLGDASRRKVISVPGPLYKGVVIAARLAPRRLVRWCGRTVAQGRLSG